MPEHEGTQEMSTEVAGSEGAAEQVQDTGETLEGQGQEQATGEAQPAAESQPNYITREAYEESMGAMADQIMSRFEEKFRGIEDQNKRLQTLLSRQGRQSQLQRKPLIPNEEEFENYSTRDLHRLLKGLTEQHTRSIQELKRERIMEQRAAARQAEADRIYNHLDSNTEAVVGKMPIFKNSPANQRLLQNAVLASVVANNGDLGKVNITQIAQSLAKDLSHGAPQPRTAQPARPGTVSNAAATKPGAPQKKEPETIEEWLAQADEDAPMVQAHLNAMFGEQ